MNTRRSSTFAISLAITLGIVGGLRAEQVEEKYPDGQLKARYAVKEEKKHGKYEEFHENGKPKVRANYLNDELAGAYQSFDESGTMRIAAVYRAGKLHGKYLERTPKGQPELAGEYVSGRRHGKFVRYANGKPERTFVYRDDDVVAIDGAVTHPYTKGEIAQVLAKIYSTRFLPPPKPKVKVAEKAKPEIDYAKKLMNFPTDEEMNAVRRLNAYRFLCGLPADVYLNPEYTYFAYKGAALCAKLGDIEHEPPNPGLPQEEYADGFRGTSNSNLHTGQDTMSRSLDGYMNDSDDKNIKHVGHRRWCLNVEMQATGFGDKEKFHAMWSMDHGRRDIPKWQAVPGLRKIG